MVSMLNAALLVALILLVASEECCGGWREDSGELEDGDHRAIT